MMLHCGDSHTGSVEPQTGCEKLLHRGENRNSVLGSGLCSTRLVRLHSRHQLNAESRRFEFTIDTKMIAAKCTRSGNRNTQFGLACYLYAPLPSTAIRQRL